MNYIKSILQDLIGLIINDPSTLVAGLVTLAVLELLNFYFTSLYIHAGSYITGYMCAWASVSIKANK